jgi:hypothetical protein
MTRFLSKSRSFTQAFVSVNSNQVVSGSGSSTSTSTGNDKPETAANASAFSTKLSQVAAFEAIKKRLEVEDTTVTYDTETTTDTNTAYPWINGNKQINAFLMWQGNFESNQTVSTAYYFKSVSQPQISYSDPADGALVQGTGTYTYSDQIPTGSNVNCVILFTGYSNVSTCLNSLTNYTTGNNMYSLAQNYFATLPSGTPYLICLSLGGGTNTGGWNTGTAGAIYLIYQAVTPNGNSFSYVETGTGSNVTLTGTGTGILYNQWNSLFFDIETWYNTSSGGSSNYGSSGQDFINLFNYIKSPNSTFGSTDSECVIIISMAHSCSNYNGTGQSVFSTLYSDTTGSYEYISNQMYTQNIGSTNEYAANYNILWNNSYNGANNSFNYYLTNYNTNYSKYGVNMFLPCINLPNLYQSGGTNSTYPNLYWYQSNGNTTSPSLAAPSGYATIQYLNDYGIAPFFNSIMNGVSGQSQTDGTIGGYIQWVNGTLTTNN